MRIILINGKRFDQTNLIHSCVVIENGLITSFDRPHEYLIDDQIIDCEGKFISPGLVDVHVHLREPGYTHKETILSGTQAAARGGFTTICAMPNTNPVPDTIENLNKFYEIVQKDALVHVYAYAPITHHLTSTQLTDQTSLREAGAIAFTNDGVGVQDAKVMFDAFKQAALTQSIIAAHAEDDRLKNGGVVHEGWVSERFNLPGIPSVSESTQVARDVLLAEACQAKYHVCHVSSKETVRVIKDAKKAGIRVSAEVTPHHLLLNEEDIQELNTNYKMNPPLRSKLDQESLINGLLDGTIDCIATDHAPHHISEKQLDMVKAPFGIIGLEYAFALLYTKFVREKKFSLKQLVDWMTIKPSELFKLKSGKLDIGCIADIAIFDLESKIIIPNTFVSKSSNSPFINHTVYGDCVLTIVGGEIKWRKQ
jgi:dihydroorotase